MKKLVVFNIFIVLLYLCILLSLTTASEIGESSCRYLGEMEEDGVKCHEDVVKIKRLPKHCTSFVYDGVICRPSYNIEPKDALYGLERLGTLVDFEDRAHHVYLFYSHGNLTDWYNILLRGDLQLVAQNVQNFIRDHPVKGLILNELDYPYSNEVDGDFYQNFTTYVQAIKNNNSNLEIGLYLSARIFIENKSNMTGLPSTSSPSTSLNCTTPPYFNFSKINSIMDFYIIEFATLNECSIDLLHSGITPMKSVKPDIMTLYDFVAALDNSTIAKDKLYFEFLINPKPLPGEVGKFKPCEISYNEYCENENNNRGTWCIDNTGTLYEKGAFSQKYAKGFIGRFIDLVDRDDLCNCGKYVTFDMMVNGYNGETDPKYCSALRIKRHHRPHA